MCSPSWPTASAPPRNRVLLLGDRPDGQPGLRPVHHRSLERRRLAAPDDDGCAAEGPTLTRRVIALFDQARCVINRFSITSLRQLDEVHAAFTPQELLAVEMVLQNKGALTHKAVAGRVLSRRESFAREGREPTATETKIDTGTIACVTGFLSTWSSVGSSSSPLCGFARWPLGYRIYDEGRFGSAGGVRSARSTA